MRRALDLDPELVGEADHAEDVLQVGVEVVAGVLLPVGPSAARDDHQTLFGGHGTLGRLQEVDARLERDVDVLLDHVREAIVPHGAGDDDDLGVVELLGHVLDGPEERLVVGRAAALEEPHLGGHVAHVVGDEAVGPEVAVLDRVGEGDVGEEGAGGVGDEGGLAGAGVDVEDVGIGSGMTMAKMTQSRMFHCC